MKRILITGAGSYVGTSVERWLMREPDKFHVDTLDMMGDEWRQADFCGYDTVFHVAGIAHVDPRPEQAPLYYQVNRDLAVETAVRARECGVRQFIFMSSMIVYHASRSMMGTYITPDTQPLPNDFYGDSKLQAEIGLHKLENDVFRVVILRPCMIYGPGSKGNFPRLVALAQKVPVFPAWHNRRSMLYIDNLSEMVRQIILRDLSGTFHPQNAEYSDTVEIIRHFAVATGHRIWVTRLLNPLVWLGAPVLKAIPKMLSDSCYAPEMSSYEFDYQIVGLEESLRRI